MIPANSFQNQPRLNWKTVQASAITEPAELLELLELDPSWLPAAQAAARLFPLRVPRGFVARMRRGDPLDPLLRQVLPLGEELAEVEGYGFDPVGDTAAGKAPGLLQKYAGRVLLTTTGACGVHCRYCFRRHFAYAEHNPRKDWPAVLAAIEADPGITEVILSGGDPLTLDTPRLAAMTAALSQIPHVRRLRIHSRQPVVLPERIDGALLEWLRDLSFETTLVIHANHANELDSSVRTALTRVRQLGTVTLLNQSVLLRGVNDDADALVALSERLFSFGVLPYYLHLLDPVAGAAHFDVPDTIARELLRKIHARLSGYLVPRLVREIPGHAGKTLINL